jgi:hypothetical protein
LRSLLLVGAGALGVAAVAAVVLVAWATWDQVGRVRAFEDLLASADLAPRDQLALQKDLLQAELTARVGLVGPLVQLLVGTGILLGAYFTWRNLRIAAATLQTTQKGQVTERFTRAIDQLGNANDRGEPNLEVRLGGIYALEGVARDSDEYRGPVTEVLTAYIRKNAPVRAAADFVDDLQPARFDVQAVMTVLARLGIEHLDLGGADLHEVHLTEARLPRANLGGTNLQGVFLAGADLREAFLSGVRAPMAYFRGADLRGANLDGADLHGSSLSEAKLEGANLAEADLRGVNLSGATGLAWESMRGAKLDLEAGMTLPVDLQETMPEEVVHVIGAEARAFLERVSGTEAQDR